MKLALITEMKVSGQIKQTNGFALFNLMAAGPMYHLNWDDVSNNISQLENFDTVVCIIPKTKPIFSKIIGKMKKYTAVCILQEGPVDYFQSWTPEHQINYLKAIKEADVFAVANEEDRKFYEPLRAGPTIRLRTPIELDLIKRFYKEKEHRDLGIFIGGNTTRWYNGATSIMVCEGFDLPVTIPSLGRSYPNESVAYKDFIEISQAPFMQKNDFWTLLSRMKASVHLFPQAAGGNIALECAALGVPMIGNHKSSAVVDCFPDLAIDCYDIKTAKSLLHKLLCNDEFWDNVTSKSKENVKHYDSKVVMGDFKKELAEVLG